MNLLASPIFWVLAGLFYFIFKKDGLDHSSFKPPTKESGLTITKAKAKSISEKLLDIFDDWFVSEEEILFSLHSLNEKDFMLVYDAFGLKTKSLFGDSPSYSAVGDELDLVQWLTIQVTTSNNKRKLMNQFPNIF